jgi:hypothetical protein
MDPAGSAMRLPQECDGADRGRPAFGRGRAIPRRLATVRIICACAEFQRPNVTHSGSRKGSGSRPWELLWRARERSYALCRLGGLPGFRLVLDGFKATLRAALVAATPAGKTFGSAR